MGSLVCWVYNEAYCIWCCNSVGLCLLTVLSHCISLFSVCWLFLSLLSSPKMFTWQSPPHFLLSSPSLYYRTCVLARTQMHTHHAPVPSQRVNSGVPQASWTVLLHNAGISVCERILTKWARLLLWCLNVFFCLQKNFAAQSWMKDGAVFQSVSIYSASWISKSFMIFYRGTLKCLLRRFFTQK